VAAKETPRQHAFMPGGKRLRLTPFRRETPDFTVDTDFLPSPATEREFKDWLRMPPGTPPPSWLLQLLNRYDPEPAKRERAEILLCDGGGVRLSAFAPLIAMSMGRRPDLLIGSSASTFFMEAIAMANSPADLAEALKAVANVPFPTLFAKDPSAKREQCSAAELIRWRNEANGGRVVNDSLFPEGRRPPGLEGMLHSTQVTLSVGIVDKSVATRVTGGRKLQPGECMEVSLWDAMFANFQHDGVKGTKMFQVLYPDCLFEKDPEKRNQLSAFGKLLAPVFGGDTMNHGLAFLDHQTQAEVNANSSRNPLGIKALAYCLENGDLLIIADGQLLGPIPLVTSNDMPEAIIRAVRTMPVDWWKAYRNTSVQEIDFSGDKTAAVDFANFSLESAYEMMAKGLTSGFGRLDQLRRQFEHVDPFEMYCREMNWYPFGVEHVVNAPRIIAKSLPALLEMVPKPRHVRAKMAAEVSSMFRREAAALLTDPDYAVVTDPASLSDADREIAVLERSLDSPALVGASVGMNHP
jgi:hypothetical protein